MPLPSPPSLSCPCLFHPVSHALVFFTQSFMPLSSVQSLMPLTSPPSLSCPCLLHPISHDLVFSAQSTMPLSSMPSLSCPYLLRPVSHALPSPSSSPMSHSQFVGLYVFVYIFPSLSSHIAFQQPHISYSSILSTN